MIDRDVFEFMAKYAYRQSLKNLTERDFLIAMVIFAATLIIGTGISAKTHGWNRSKTIFLSVLLPYLYLVLMFAVFGRDERRYPFYELQPFWSYYEAFANGKHILLLACFLNVLMFMPLGICLAGLGVKFRYALLAGACISYFIEVSQFLFRKGLFELFDDPFHNVLGTMLGYLLLTGFRKIFSNLKQE